MASNRLCGHNNTQQDYDEGSNRPPARGQVLRALPSKKTHRLSCLSQCSGNDPRQPGVVRTSSFDMLNSTGSSVGGRGDELVARSTRRLMLIWRCSILQSTASFAAATSSALRWMTFPPNGYAIDRATVRQRKTGRPVRFELTEQTRQAIDDHIRLVARSQTSFCSRVAGQGMTTRQYARLLPTFVVEAPSSPLPQGERARTARTK
jgi:hypothetical protein